MRKSFTEENKTKQNVDSEKHTVWSGAANKVRVHSLWPPSVKHPGHLRHFWSIRLRKVHFHPQLSFLVNTEGNHFQLSGRGQTDINTFDAKFTLSELCFNI